MLQHYNKILQKYPHVKSCFEIPYSELLSTIEWKGFRDTIEERDGHVCQDCGESARIKEESLKVEDKVEQREINSRLSLELHDKVSRALNILNEQAIKKKPQLAFVTPKSYLDTIRLEIHHTYYLKNQLPWDYPHDSLRTLCRNCHQNEHNNNFIPVYSDESKDNMISENCACSKCSGTGYLEEYDYYQNGICFSCNGWGINLK